VYYNFVDVAVNPSWLSSGRDVSDDCDPGMLASYFLRGLTCVACT